MLSIPQKPERLARVMPTLPKHPRKQCKSAIQMLSLYLLPHELVHVSDETLLQQLRAVAKRGLGLGRIKNLKEAASRSVGIREGSELAKMELKLLLTQYEWFHNKLEELAARLDELLIQIPHVQQLLAIKGIGRDRSQDSLLR
jgi:transposase